MNKAIVILVALCVCMMAGAQTEATLPWREWLTRWSAIEARYQAIADQRRHEEEHQRAAAVRAEIARTMAAFESAWAQHGASNEVMEPLEAAIQALAKDGQLETRQERDRADELLSQLYSLHLALWDTGLRAQLRVEVSTAPSPAPDGAKP